MKKPEITEDMIFACFAAANPCEDSRKTAESFIDVEMYENQVMYPEFARWAEQAGYPELASLFRKVAGEEKLHAIWLQELYDDIGTPARGDDTQRAITALETIQANCDALIKMNPDGVIEKALKVAIMVEQREAIDIYPEFRDRELKNGNQAAADIYQRVVDSESRHMNWFKSALNKFTSVDMQAVPA
ncbi:MAG: ferritin family protein [Gammaproteobacteria bacterium]|nr:ferritin family protein [Gammaproteobacteria bacterium]